MSNDKKMLSSIGYYKSSFQPLELHLYDMSHKNIEHVNMQASAVPIQAQPVFKDIRDHYKP